MLGKYTSLDMNELTPRQRRQIRTRDAILDAARQIIAADGVANLSMRGIAKRIDYSPAGLYEYFGSKDEIIAAVCLQGAGRLYQGMAAVDNCLPPTDYLVEIGLAYINFAVKNKDHFLLMFTSDVQPPPEAFEADSSLDILVAAIQKGIDSNVFIPKEGLGVTEMAYMAWSLVHGVAMLRITQMSFFPEEFAADDRMILQTAVSGLTKSD